VPALLTLWSRHRDAATDVNNAGGGWRHHANGRLISAGVANTRVARNASANELQVDPPGQHDHIHDQRLVRPNARASVQSIKTADGDHRSQLAQMASAMAAYSAGNPGSSTQTSQMPNDPTLQNAVAEAWP